MRRYQQTSALLPRPRASAPAAHIGYRAVALHHRADLHRTSKATKPCLSRGHCPVAASAMATLQITGSKAAHLHRSASFSSGNYLHSGGRLCNFLLARGPCSCSKMGIR
jgi:hypothetical protein